MTHQDPMTNQPAGKPGCGNMAPMVDFGSLNNNYYAMRHGHSLANEQGIIVSDPANGVPGYGLSECGRQQVADSAGAIGAITGAGPDCPLVIISSDFSRARETAEIVFRHMEHAWPVKLEQRLRERYFGDLEGRPDTLYTIAWQDDRENPGQPTCNVESLQSVSLRATALVAELERTVRGSPVLLVAHGDILQILQCVFRGIDPGRHRSLEHLENAEVRLLNPD